MRRVQPVIVAVLALIAIIASFTSLGAHAMGTGFYGGGGIKDVFRAKTDHTGFVQLGTLSTPGASATTLAHKAIRFGSNESGSETGVQTSKVVFSADGVPTISYTHTDIHSSALVAFEAVACPKTVTSASSSTKSEVKFENRKINSGGGSTSGVPMLIIDYGAANEDGVLVTCMLAVFQKTSFGQEFKDAETLNMFNIDAVGIAPTADMTIPKEFFDATICTVAADVTLPKDTYRIRNVYPAAA
jgi:hypothetical protein